jgi:hypothetical protein
MQRSKFPLMAATMAAAAISMPRDSTAHGFRDYLGAMDDYLGDDDMLGAPSRRSRPFGRAAARPVAQAAARALSTAAPGVPTAGPRLEPLGFPVFGFVNAGPTTITQLTNPQKPFKGSRLTMDIARTGASATGLVTVTALKVGARDVLVNSNPIGAGTFAPGAFGVELMMDTATPGVNIAATIALGAPVLAAAATVDVSCTVIGMTWS